MWATWTKRLSQVLKVIMVYSKRGRWRWGGADRNSYWGLLRISQLRADSAEWVSQADNLSNSIWCRKGIKAPNCRVRLGNCKVQYYDMAELQMAGESGDRRSLRFRLWCCQVWPVVKFQLDIFSFHFSKNDLTKNDSVGNGSHFINGLTWWDLCIRKPGSETVRQWDLFRRSLDI